MALADITAAAGAIGPTAAILLYLVVQNRGRPDKCDPIRELTDALAAIRERLVRIETLMGVKDKE